MAPSEDVLDLDELTGSSSSDQPDEPATEPVDETPTEGDVEALAASVPDRATEDDVQRDDVHVIHFLEDGFTCLGRVWYRGQELAVREGTDQWDAITDTKGNTFLSLSPSEQIDRWGVQFFADGPWPYERPDPDGGEALGVPTDPEEIIKQRKRRQREQLAQARRR